jgi:hypothetical protein
MKTNRNRGSHGNAQHNAQDHFSFTAEIYGALGRAVNGAINTVRDSQQDIDVDHNKFSIFIAEASSTLTFFNLHEQLK